MLLAGFGAIRAGANREVLDFIERYQIPLITTLDGKGIVDESHPLAIGVFADSGHKSAWDLFLDSDVVIGLGNSFAQHATFDFRDDLFENRKLVHIDVDSKPDRQGLQGRPGHHRRRPAGDLGARRRPRLARPAAAEVVPCAGFR